MNNVVNLFDHVAASPVVVLVDLLEPGVMPPSGRTIQAALNNCRLLVNRARAISLPIAFVRRRSRDPAVAVPPPSGWATSLLPRRVDMVFERDRPSCYSSPEFARVVQDCGGHLVLAGFAGEPDCLSTLVEAYHRGHRAVYLWDASASHALGKMSADDTHAVLTEIMRDYAEVANTKDWITRAHRRLVGV